MAGQQTALAKQPISGDLVFQLLDHLRAAGFALSAREYLVAQEIASVCQDDDGQVDGGRLCNWLAPVLCGSPQQQADFHRVFKIFWSAQAAEQTASEKPQAEAASQALEVIRQSQPWKWVAALMLALVACSAALWWYDTSRREAELEQQVADEAPEQLPPGVAAEVPDVGGLVLDEAIAMLAGFELRAETQFVASDELPPNVVLTQNPTAGTSLEIGSSVLLQISEEPVTPNQLEVRTAVHDGQGKLIGGATVSLSHVLGEHPGEVVRAKVSPDGRSVVTAGLDGLVKVWSVSDSTPPDVHPGHDGQVWSIQFSPLSTRVATASDDGTARIWDIGGSESKPAPRELSRQIATTRVGKTSLGVAPGVESLLPAVEGGPENLVLEGHQGSVMTASFSPDGGRIVTASHDQTARVWDAAFGAQLAVLQGHRAAVLGAVFSPDGDRIATAGGDGTVRIWDSNDSRQLLVLEADRDFQWQPTFSADGERILAVSNDFTFQVWDLSSGDAVLPQAAPGPEFDAPADFRFEDGKMVSILADLDERLDLSEGDGALASSRDAGLVVASEGADDLRLWHLATTEDSGAALLAREVLGGVWQASVSHPNFHAPEPFALPPEPGELVLEATMTPRGENWKDIAQARATEIAAALAFLPLLAGGCWWGWRRGRHKLILERRASREHETAGISLPEPRHELYSGRGFLRTRVETRRRYAFGPGDLDAAATVDETVRRLGFFSPIHRHRLRLPVYLALIDRAGFRDQQAKLVDQLLDELEAGGVAIDRFYFDRDPRLCARAERGDGTQRNLQELAAAHPNHRLLLFGDAQGLADPVTGRIASWSEQFSAWRERGIMTPVPASRWQQREMDLAAAGFQVLPLSPVGLELFAEIFGTADSVPALPRPWRAAFPQLFAERPGRWLERHAPSAAEIDNLCRQLRRYLGRDGYRWLCSLTVYPELEWFLTLYVGLRLHDADGQSILSEQALLELTRLPWLRHGTMPNWLRLRLVSELSPEDEDTVRALLRDLLQARLEAPGSEFRLEVARPDEGKKKRAWSRLFTDLVRTEPTDSPLNDYVFVEFLRGKRPDKLQLLAPKNWHRWVYHRGLRSLGLRPVAILALVGLLSAAGLGAGSLLQRIDRLLPPDEPSTIAQVDFTAQAIRVVVPDVKGRLLPEAEALLAVAGLQASRDLADQPDDLITDQSPEPGTFAEMGSEIFLAKQAPVGHLRVVDYPKDAQTAQLTVDGRRWPGYNLELAPGTHTVTFYSGDASEETEIQITRGQITDYSVPDRFRPWRPDVTGIDPPFGAQGATVTLTFLGSGLSDRTLARPAVFSRLSQGEKVRDRTVQVAIDGEGVGLRGGTSYPANQGIPVTIASDAPAGKRKITLTDEYGRTFSPSVTFEVRVAVAVADPVTVPNVVGLSLKEAAGVLGPDLELGFVAPGTESRTVSSQTPAAGAQVQSGTRVSLVLASESIAQQQVEEQQQQVEEPAQSVEARYATLYAEAYLAYEAGDWARAIDAVDEALVLNPGSSGMILLPTKLSVPYTPYFLLARTALELSRCAQASDAFFKAEKQESQILRRFGDDLEALRSEIHTRCQPEK